MATRLPQADLSEVSAGLIEQFGFVPSPVEVMWHHPGVVEASGAMGAMVRSWDACDEGLKSFANIAVASQVGCGWCLDYGYFHAQDEGLDMTKASQVPRWRQSDVFTPLERDVLEYAEAMTNTPPTATDELVARLVEQLGPKAVVELTAFVAFTNFATRANASLGIESQGFSATCEIPLAARP